MLPIEYNVKRHIEDVKSGNVDLNDFIARVIAKSKGIQEKFSPFITLQNQISPPSKKGMLFGLPISVKDCICTEGIQSTAGSRILEGYIPPFDATSVRMVKDEGGFILGKTAQDEFGFGTFSTNCAYNIPKNPLDTKRTCGGSSGGASCLTAAADFPHIALAESTGGSITCPAAFTGTVGLTPTYGLVSRWGLIDYANSLDKIGVIAKEVYDVALGLSVIAGHDPMDSTSLNSKGQDFTRHLKGNVKNVKIGVPKEYFENISPEISDTVWDGIKKLESEGAVIKEISLPLTEFGIAAYYILAISESSTNLAKFCGMRYGLHDKLEGNFDQYFSKVRGKGFGEEAKRRIILGTYSRMAGFRDAYYLKALKVRTKIIEEFKKAFKSFDVLVTPSMPILPPTFKEIEKLEPVEVYMMDVLTVCPNLAGIPTLSVPAGSSKGLPVGMQIIGDHMQEEKILNVGHTLEQVSK